MTYTSHGHPIPGTVHEEAQPENLADCGGVARCSQCFRDAEKLTIAKQRAKSQHFEERADPSKIDLVDWDIDANRPVSESQPAEIHERRQGLERELTTLLNRHSEENESGTPDFILAGFLIGVLDAYNKTLGERAVWRGESVELPALQRISEDSSALQNRIRENYSRMSDEEKSTIQGAINFVLAPGALDSNDDKEVPLVIYTNGQRNEIGTAKLYVTPGEVYATGNITGALPIFGKENISAAYSLELNEPKDEPSTGPFTRYQQKGLTENE